MTKIPNKQSVPTAVTDYTRFPLQYPHVTTGNFMEFSVADAIEIVPHQVVDCTHKNFVRLNSLIAPTFGDAMIHNKTFFVPFRVVMPGFQDFIDGLEHLNTIGVSPDFIDVVHTMYNNTFVTFLIGNTCSTLEDSFDSMPEIDDTMTYDFVIYNQSTNKLECYNFTEYGRRVWKILNALGYKITPELRTSNLESEIHSAMPLLCLTKIYMDWYYPSAYYQDDRAYDVVRLFNYDNANVAFCDYFTSNDLEAIFNVIQYVCYDTDLFVSSFDRPTGPNGNQETIVINDITQPNDLASYIAVEDQSNGTPYYNPEANMLTQYGMTALKALTDYVKRHQLSGSRNIDNYLSRWGIVLNSDKLRLSMHLNSSNQFIEFGDVFSTADTESANLGDYAGKGYSMGNNSFTFENQEFGMLITISSIVPMVDYYQGAAKHTKHFERFDFFSPEFDNLGNQALSTKEVYCPSNIMELFSQDERDSATLPGFPINFHNKVFSFVPRYSEYKTGRSKLTGDFILNSMHTGYGAWHLMRDLSPYFAKWGRFTKHDISFVLGTDSRQYDRLFYADRSLGDTFKIYHMFKYDMKFPGKSLYDSYEFTDEDKAQKVSVDTGGVKAN